MSYNNEKQDILQQLKLIALLPSGKKFSFADGKLVVYNDTYYNRLTRFIYQDGRYKTMVVLKSFYTSVFEAIKSESDNKTKELIKNYLNDSIIGLKTLQNTYRDDVNTVLSLTCLIDTITMNNTI